MGLFETILNYFGVILYYVGSEGFYILLFPLIYWCFNKSIGKRVLIIILLSGYIGVLLKGYGFESGYYIGIFSLWGYFFTISNKKSTKLLSMSIILLSILVGFFTGLLPIFEIVLGLLVGVIILTLFLVLEPGIKDLCNQKYNVSQRIFLVLFFTVAAAVLLVLIGVTDLLIPIAILGSCLGGLIGIILEKEYVSFSTNGSIIFLIGRYILGLILIGLIHYGVEFIIISLDFINPFLTFLRYGITLFIGTYFIPRLFLYVKLAERY